MLTVRKILTLAYRLGKKEGESGNKEVKNSFTESDDEPIAFAHWRNQ